MQGRGVGSWGLVLLTPSGVTSDPRKIACLCIIAFTHAIISTNENDFHASLTWPFVMMDRRSRLVVTGGNGMSGVTVALGRALLSHILTVFTLYHRYC